MNNKIFTKLNKSVVMITGASGLIGINLLATLSEIRKQKQIKFKVIAITQSSLTIILKSFIHKEDKIVRGDLTNYNFTKSLPMADLIIHAAGYGQPNKFLENPVETILINTTATAQLIKRLKNNGHFLFISSSEVYSGLDNPPFTENQIGTTTPQHIRSCYIEGKRCGEAICTTLSSSNNHIIVARLSLAYGPGTKKNDQRVMNTFIKQAIIKKHIKLLDSGRAKRTYCYITDAIEMLLNIAVLGTKPVYNIGGKSHTSIINLAKLIGNYTKAKIIFPKISKTVKGSPDNVFISMKLYEEEFGKKKYISLREGLKKTIIWQRELYE